jgi:hypothetical protein
VVNTILFSYLTITEKTGDFTMPACLARGDLLGPSRRVGWMYFQAHGQEVG